MTNINQVYVTKSALSNKTTFIGWIHTYFCIFLLLFINQIILDDGVHKLQVMWIVQFGKVWWPGTSMFTPGDIQLLSQYCFTMKQSGIRFDSDP